MRYEKSSTTNALIMPTAGAIFVADAYRGEGQGLYKGIEFVILARDRSAVETLGYSVILLPQTF